MNRPAALLGLSALLVGCASIAGADFADWAPATGPSHDASTDSRSAKDGPTGSHDDAGDTDSSVPTKCSPSTCAGCCEGNVCRTGDWRGACGQGGAACAVCDEKSICKDKVCVGGAGVACEPHQDASAKSCEQICSESGGHCTMGCYSRDNEPTPIVGVVKSAATCAAHDATITKAETGCDVPIPSTVSTIVECCCLVP